MEAGKIDPFGEWQRAWVGEKIVRVHGKSETVWLLIGRSHGNLESEDEDSPFRTMKITRMRSVPLVDDGAAVALATAAGPHGIYVRNALAMGDCTGLLFLLGDEPRGLCWFSDRGNIVVIAHGLDAGQVAAAILASGIRFRMAMGPADVLDSLLLASAKRALVHRDQLYYAGERSTAVLSPQCPQVRLAVPMDRDRLAQATLQLNESDFHLDPARVDRRWLRDSVQEKLLAGSTYVLGPVGGLLGKLDLGSTGPAGSMIEGVFTFPEARGQGVASALVAQCLHNSALPVHLHVAAHNQPARRAYTKAGMQEVGRCRLLLL